MTVQDLWCKRDGSPSARHGQGKRWRVVVPGYPATSHRTKAEADLINAQRIAAGPPSPADTTTVGELLDVWLATKQGRADATRRTAATTYRQIIPRWRDVLAADVQRHDVQIWLAELAVTRRDGPRIDAGQMSASRSTRAKCLQALSGALEIAVQQGAIARNPCERISLGRVERKPVDVLTPGEIAALAEADPAHASLYWLLATCGLRISEAAALSVGDINPARGRLVVRRSKTKQAREVPVPEKVLGMLDLDRPQDQPLFLNSRGGRFDGRAWARGAMKRAAATIGRPSLTPHMFRHTAASLAIASGADVKAVQRMLGHATAAMTLDTYGHLWDRGLDDVAARMDRFVA